MYGLYGYFFSFLDYTADLIGLVGFTRRFFVFCFWLGVMVRISYIIYYIYHLSHILTPLE